MSDDNFLSRWSRRKTEAKTATPAPKPAQEVAQPVAPPAIKPAEPAPQPLPPVESLTPESDFTPFMKPDVDASVKRQALKQLFRDPQFNVMDGLDVYIDDYSKPDPLPEGWLEKLSAVKRLGIFQEPSEEARDELAAGNAALQKPMEEQPVAQPPVLAPADTSNAANPPSEVGKTELPRE